MKNHIETIEGIIGNLEEEIKRRNTAGEPTAFLHNAIGAFHFAKDNLSAELGSQKPENHKPKK